MYLYYIIYESSTGMRELKEQCNSEIYIIYSSIKKVSPNLPMFSYMLLWALQSIHMTERNQKNQDEPIEMSYRVGFCKDIEQHCLLILEVSQNILPR